MNIKKEVIENVAEKLRSQQQKLKRECERNAYSMKKLGEENTVKKREIAKLGELIKSLNTEERGLKQCLK